MDTPTTIRLLANKNNVRGDLFTRLIKDLFFALGYDDLRLNIQKAGRELDIQGLHRFESRQLIAECKAHSLPIGGGDVNKFLGVLTRERVKAKPTPVAGYFVSVSGFTETCKEQEAESGCDGVILLTGKQIIEELVRSRVVVSVEQATERAGECVKQANSAQLELEKVELLGHSRGYVWAVYYSTNKERSHYAFIHADGTPLAAAVAKEVCESEKSFNLPMRSLQYLAPRTVPYRTTDIIASLLGKYREWVAEDCGFIQLDGLPADTDLSATRLKLERLFIPLKVTSLVDEDERGVVQGESKEYVRTIGELLRGNPHIAILAMPGGGKSTLIKRLVTAYANSQRLKEIRDDLPEKDWLPLLLRCRELRDRAHRPILELLDDIPRHAGLNSEELCIFRDHIHTMLRSGKVLLLIDGLDEISDEGSRQTFTGHLRTFIAMFPQVVLVITSREAGFRLVASVVASVCEQVRLAPLDESDVENLCERWHVEVVGDTEKVRKEAKDLGRTIWKNHSIRTLAENPLLLTTLLVVKRCVGELPRSRTTLYKEAIRVLLRTWNVEGYEPLDEDEALAQLSYVACSMMTEGKQQIGQRALLKLLKGSRYELEAELQFARISPQDFITRVEYRSSLLMQTGHARIENELQPVFEFRHLTFQEYLAARGFVEEQYPGRDQGQAIADLLQPHFGEERWREVVALAAVLAGRKAEELIKRLTIESQQYGRDMEQPDSMQRNPQRLLLHQCVRDEVQVSSATLRLVLRELGRDASAYRARDPDWISAILRGRGGMIYREIVEQAYLEGGPRFEEFASAFAEISMHSRFGENPVRLTDAIIGSLCAELEDGADRLKSIQAATIVMSLAFRLDQVGKKDQIARANFSRLEAALSIRLDKHDMPTALASSWALAWIGENRLSSVLPSAEVIIRLFRLLRDGTPLAIQRFFAWALSSQRLLPRDTFPVESWGDCDDFLKRAIEISGKSYWKRIRHAALIVGWYRQSPWTDSELVDLLKKDEEVPNFFFPTLKDLSSSLGIDLKSAQPKQH